MSNGNNNETSYIDIHGSHPFGLGYDHPNNEPHYYSTIPVQPKNVYYKQDLTDDERKIMNYIFNNNTNDLKYVRFFKRKTFSYTYCVEYKYEATFGPAVCDEQVTDYWISFVVRLYRIENDYQCFDVIRFMNEGKQIHLYFQ